MGMIKYRIHEVAKDFNVTSKVISQILTDYIAAPKNHMQVLENHELDVIFQYMTQHNQAASLEDIFKVAPKPAAPAKEPAPAKEAEAKPAAAPAKAADGKPAAKPAEAAELLCKAVPELDPALISAAQASISPEYISDAASWGVIDPERIVVAYGENYRYEACMARRVSRDVRSYLLEVSRLWPQVKTHVLTPLWHDETAYPSQGMSCHEQVPSFIAAHTAPHDQMTLIDGLELTDHDPDLFADGYEHPNERGCRQIATRLNTVMRVPGLRPSSVGKRRKPRGGAKPKAGKGAKQSKAPSETSARAIEPGVLRLPLDDLL